MTVSAMVFLGPHQTIQAYLDNADLWPGDKLTLFPAKGSKERDTMYVVGRDGKPREVK